MAKRIDTGKAHKAPYTLVSAGLLGSAFFFAFLLWARRRGSGPASRPGRLRAGFAVRARCGARRARGAAGGRESAQSQREHRKGLCGQYGVLKRDLRAKRLCRGDVRALSLRLRRARRGQTDQVESRSAMRPVSPGPLLCRKTAGWDVVSVAGNNAAVLIR